MQSRWAGLVSSYSSWRHERAERLGYDLSLKRLAVAYGIEAVVIAASLAGAWYFAQHYGHGDRETIGVMMLAPVSYAVLEFCRVPLATSARTQRSWAIKIAAFIGMVCAAFVTVKSMSQLGYLTFQPRLEEVTRTTRELKDLEAQRDSRRLARESAMAALAQRKEDVASADARIGEAAQQLAGLAKPQCGTSVFQQRGGRAMRVYKCTPDPRAAMLNEALLQAQKDRGAAVAAFEVARRELDAVDLSTLDAKVIAAETAHKDSLFRSQLHTFAAMVFGKDPVEVSEGELHGFLRLFVFLPAVCVAFASSLLAFTAVERLPRKREAIVPDEAGAYVLGPFAEVVLNEARAVVERTAADVLRDAAEAARRAGGSTASTEGRKSTDGEVSTGSNSSGNTDIEVERRRPMTTPTHSASPLAVGA